MTISSGLRCAVCLVDGLIVSSRASAQIQVVDMIPNALSGETRVNPEPYIPVNPNNPQIIAATAFMQTPSGSANGPLLVSLDGGSTWAARNVIPSTSGGTNALDMTIRFNSSGSALYLAMVRNDAARSFVVANTTDLTFVTPL